MGTSCAGSQPRAKYGPVAPLGSRGIRRRIWELYKRGPWLARVREEIEVDPEAAALAFARLAGACSVCARPLALAGAPVISTTNDHCFSEGNDR